VNRRDDIVRIARSWIGTPFRHQGRTRFGIDCVGLLVAVADELGIAAVDVPGYNRRSHGKDFMRPFEEHCRPRTFGQMAPGDIVIFHDELFPCHTGIYSQLRGVAHVVHAVATLRQVFETPYAGEWAARARHVFAFPGTEL
jgi:cell wall-associated NlpC family hydrolase